MPKSRKKPHPQTARQKRRLTVDDLGPNGRVGRTFKPKAEYDRERESLLQLCQQLALGMTWDRFRFNALTALIYDTGSIPENAVHDKMREQLLDPTFDNTPEITIQELLHGPFDFSKEEQISLAHKAGHPEWEEFLEKYHTARQLEKERHANASDPDNPILGGDPPAADADGDTGADSAEEDTVAEQNG